MLSTNPGSGYIAAHARVLANDSGSLLSDLICILRGGQYTASVDEAELQWIRASRLIPLKKKDGGVRPIGIGSYLR
ncbi:MAG: hypothetical protein AAGM67_22075, partial [Bacteroidota bacterium]